MMSPSFLLTQNSLVLAQISDPADRVVSIQTALLVIVTIALILVVKALGHLRARVDELERGKPAESSTSAAQSPRQSPGAASSSAGLPASDSPSAEVLAVIAAAIHVTLAGRARIIGITPAIADDRTWSLEGRRHIFHSHKVR